MFERWGGEDALIARIVRVIEHFRPSIVIAPDGPGPALEHFEHQATGAAVFAAIEKLSASGDSPVDVLVVGTDPRQPHGYSDYEERVVMSPWDPSEDGVPPRVRQILALQAHQTQRDATVIGVEMRLALRYDYYLFYPVGVGDTDAVAYRRMLFGESL